MNICFQNKEKQQGAQNTIKQLAVDCQEITDQTHFRPQKRIL